MKNLFKVALAVALVMSSSSLFAQKFGRINMQELIGAMSETKTATTNLEAYAKDLQDNLETMQVEFNTKYTEYTKNMNTLSDAVKQSKEKDMQDLQTRMQEFEQNARQDIQRKQNELLEPIIKKAQAAVTKIAKAGAYLGVFDTSIASLAYYDETLMTDIAPAVRKELGVTESPAAAAPAK